MIRYGFAVFFALVAAVGVACTETDIETENDAPLGESVQASSTSVPTVAPVPSPGDQACGAKTCHCNGITNPPTTFTCKDHHLQVSCQREKCDTCSKMCGTGTGPGGGVTPL
jgi:hypothetical protein